jgi:hypothetical protein
MWFVFKVWPYHWRHKTVAGEYCFRQTCCFHLQDWALTNSKVIWTAFPCLCMYLWCLNNLPSKHITWNTGNVIRSTQWETWQPLKTEAAMAGRNRLWPCVGGSMDLLTMEMKVLGSGMLRNNSVRTSYLAKKWEFQWKVLVCIRHTQIGSFW